MGALASQITSLAIVYSTVYSGADQRKHQSSASLAFVRWIHKWPVNSPHKGQVMRKMLPCDDVIMADFRSSPTDTTEFFNQIGVHIVTFQLFSTSIFEKAHNLGTKNNFNIYKSDYGLHDYHLVLDDKLFVVTVTAEGDHHKCNKTFCIIPCGSIPV